MRSRLVILAPEAQDDLVSIYNHIAKLGGRAVADGYLDRLEQFLAGFDLAAERGTLRNDVRPGLRVVGFERRIAIAFVVFDETVEILRVFSGGQNWERSFS
jgi:toxin ParE1/3/4